MSLTAEWARARLDELVRPSPDLKEVAWALLESLRHSFEVAGREFHWPCIFSDEQGQVELEWHHGERSVHGRVEMTRDHWKVFDGDGEPDVVAWPLEPLLDLYA